MIYCLPFYRGYLKIVLKNDFLTDIKYIGKCLHPYDPSNQLIKRLMVYSMGKPIDFNDVKIKYLYGTVFERKVWDTVREIPYGEIRTYKWIAERLGDRYLSRAVGNALGKNPILIIIPCHRVIKSDGGLGGFSSVGGLPLKRYLLRLEKIL